MQATLRDATAIVGIGETVFAKNLEPTELELGCQAIKAALADDGIRPAEVDALSSYTMEETLAALRSAELGQVIQGHVRT